MPTTSLIFTLLILAIYSINFISTSAQPLTPEERKSCYANPRLICRLDGTRHSPGARGTVMFFPSYWPNRPEGRRCLVRIRGQFSGLTPGQHGFHIHTYGDIRRSDGKLTGGHFTNPRGDNLPHGSPDDRLRHWGDFGNITVWSGGRAVHERVDTVINIKGIIGRGIIVHAGPDLGAAEQPSGAAGVRELQGVIGYANPKGPVVSV